MIDKFFQGFFTAFLHGTDDSGFEFWGLLNLLDGGGFFGVGGRGVGLGELVEQLLNFGGFAQGLVRYVIRVLNKLCCRTCSGLEWQ